MLHPVEGICSFTVGDEGYGLQFTVRPPPFRGVITSMVPEVLAPPSKAGFSGGLRVRSTEWLVQLALLSSLERWNDASHPGLVCF